MKLYVTIGTTNGHIEREFEIPLGEFATYLGLEMEGNFDPDSRNIRTAIMRTPFSNHSDVPTDLHTICSENGIDIVEGRA
jgi:hypothetical protein